jgi:hypothetical protein
MSGVRTITRGITRGRAVASRWPAESAEEVAL